MSWQGFWVQWQRRWRIAEMRLLFLALLVSVTVVTAVGFFTNRVENHMTQQASAMLGGDLVLSSSRPLSPDYFQYAKQNGLQSGAMTKFASMASNGDSFQLTQIKAVTPSYPVKGEIQVGKVIGQPDYQVMQQGPSAGKIWVDGAVLTALKLAVGDSLQLGSATFEIEYVLLQDPDRGVNFLQLAPPAFINQQDIAATGLLSVGSRAQYEAFFGGDANQIAALTDWLKPRLQKVEQVRTLEDGLQSVQQSLQRATRFLGLSALLSVVLAGVAIVLSSASLVRRETRAVAVLKALGQVRQRIIWDYALSLLLSALLAAMIGALLGYVLQLFLSERLANLMGETLPAAGIQPVFMGFLTAIILLGGGALPYVRQLTNTAPAQILQSHLPLQNTSLALILLSVLPAIYGLFWLQTRDAILAVWILLGTIAGVVIFWLLALAILALFNYGSLRLTWRWLAVFRGARRSVLLLVVFATGFFSLLLLTTVRTDLVERWEESLPADAPNHFFINIQPQEQQAVADYLQQQQLNAEFYPMIRGRLVAVNERELKVDDYESDRAQRLLTREFNLSAFGELPESNEIIAGEWFNGKSQGGFSVEEGIAETLGFALGDQLTFDIAGVTYQQTVTSVRTVRWDSMQPNFFVIAAPGELADKPHTFITSVHIPEQKAALVPQLIQQFPSITDINVSAVLSQIRDLISRATFAVQGIFLFTLLAGLVVLTTALQSQRPERQQEIAILKSLGAAHSELRARIWIEFILLGALAGLAGGFVASVLGSLLAYYLFDLFGAFNLWPLLIGALLGAILVGFAGFLSLRGLLHIPPMLLLKG